MARGPSRLPDWIFSAPGKRRVLDALVVNESGHLWTRTELAVASQQHKKARMELYLKPLSQAGVVLQEGDHYWINADHPVVEPLRALLLALRDLPDEEIDR